MCQLHQSNDIELNHFILFLPVCVHKAAGKSEARIVDQDFNAEIMFLCEPVQIQRRILFREIHRKDRNGNMIFIFKFLSYLIQLIFISCGKHKIITVLCA